MQIRIEIAEYSGVYYTVLAEKIFIFTYYLQVAVPLCLEFQKMNEAIEDIEAAERDLVEFTDEEAYGRFLDMHALHTKYLNIKGVKVSFSCFITLDYGGTLD